MGFKMYQHSTLLKGDCGDNEKASRRDLSAGCFTFQLRKTSGWELSWLVGSRDGALIHVSYHTFAFV